MVEMLTEELMLISDFRNKQEPEMIMELKVEPTHFPEINQEMGIVI
ncbi:hypothetical protein [Salmonella sp. s55004]